jgi:hypothetical protein
VLEGQVEAFTRRNEAPVNGGRNYNGPKVNDFASLSKTELYAGTSSHSRAVLAGLRAPQSQSAEHGDDPQGRLGDVPRTLRDYTFGVDQ